MIVNTSAKTSGEKIRVMDPHLIPLGESIEYTTKKYVSLSAISLIFVSKGYIEDKRCIAEFNIVIEKDNRVIPIVLDSMDDLSKLPKDLSDIQSLSLTFIGNNHKIDPKGKNLI